MNTKWVGALAAAAIASLPAAALAAPRTSMVVVGPSPDIAVSVGAGMHTYATELDKATDPGAALEVRGVYGMRQLIGGELAFVSGFNNLKNTVETNDANIASIGGEALLRANFGLKNLGVLTGNSFDLIPYVAAGGGVTDTTVADSSGKTLDTVDNVKYQASTTFHVPAAVGVDAIIMKNLTIGARAGYKYEFGNQTRVDTAKADIQSWQALGRIGYVF